MHEVVGEVVVTVTPGPASLPASLRLLTLPVTVYFTLPLLFLDFVKVVTVTSP